MEDVVTPSLYSIRFVPENQDEFQVLMYLQLKFSKFDSVLYFGFFCGFNFNNNE